MFLKREKISHRLSEAVYNKECPLVERFISLQSLEEIWTLQALRRFFELLGYGGGGTLIDTVENCLIKTISILVCIRWDEWGRFRKIFFPGGWDEAVCEGRTDQDLPYAYNVLRADSFLGGGGIAEAFFDQQSMYRPMIIKQSRLNRLGTQTLPFIKSRQVHIATGGRGIVTKEVVAICHMRFNAEFGLSQPYSGEFAVARKRLQYKGDIKAEIKNLQLLSSILSRHKCLVRHLTFIIAEDENDLKGFKEFNILLPLANTDLRKLLYQERFRAQCSDIVQLMRAARDLVDALAWLHQGQLIEEKIQVFCHTNLKLQDILVYDIGEDHFPAGCWKISVFGILTKPQFARTLSPSPAGTLASILGEDHILTSRTRHRTPNIYSAPEVHEDNGLIGPESDVWSFGCILFQVLVRGIGGDDGISFLLEMDKKLQSKENNHFCQYTNGDAHLHPAVQNWLESSSVPLHATAQVGKLILGSKKIIKGALIVDPDRRATAADLRRELVDICERSEDFGESAAGSPIAPRTTTFPYDPDKRSLNAEPLESIEIAHEREKAFGESVAVSPTTLRTLTSPPTPTSQFSQTEQMRSMNDLSVLASPAEDDDNTSKCDRSDIESIFSAESLLSSQSSQNEMFSISVSELVSLFLHDNDLLLLFRTAISKVGPSRLQRNFARFLKRYSGILEKEASSDVQSQAAKFVRISVRQTAAEIGSILRQGNVAAREAHEVDLIVSNAARVNEWLEQPKEAQPEIYPSAHPHMMDEYDISDESDSVDLDSHGQHSLHTINNVKEFMTSGQAWLSLRLEFRAWLKVDDEQASHAPCENMEDYTREGPKNTSQSPVTAMLKFMVRYIRHVRYLLSSYHGTDHPRTYILRVMDVTKQYWRPKPVSGFTRITWFSAYGKLLCMDVKECSIGGANQLQERLRKSASLNQRTGPPSTTAAMTPIAGEPRSPPSAYMSQSPLASGNLRGSSPEITPDRQADPATFTLMPIRQDVCPYGIETSLPPEEEVKKQNWHYYPCPRLIERFHLDEAFITQLLEPGHAFLDNAWSELFPKKLKTEFRYKYQQTGIGWGIHIIEDLNPIAIAWAGLLISLASGAVGVLYSVVTKDVGTGFTIAAWLTGTAALYVAWLQLSQKKTI